ncbi:MAG: hypothetical protein KDA75_12495 [Planctomycetaceae bacterium]|nr:hypothetical protein [Planctomycetaceae bacterium]
MKTFALALLAVVVASSAYAEEKSDCLAVGSRVGAFYVTKVFGPSDNAKVGEKLCYRCRYQDRPVVSVFVRDVNDEVVDLVKEVDAKVGQNKDAGMAAFVVLLSENPEADATKLEQLASKADVKNVPLTTFDGTSGPQGYKVAEDADYTVMMWVNSELKVNDTYKKGQLKEQVATVVGKTNSILN